jgi:acetyltransferase-like isoleucine patch superfamily enzyme
MNTVLRWFFLKFNACMRGIKHWWYKWLFTYIGSLCLKNLSLGKDCSFHAPVRCADGRGKLQIGGGNGFGYYCAPKLGDGALLIQPRKLSAEIIIGNNNWFSNNVSIIANEKIVIGTGCRIGDNVSFFDCDFHEIDPAHRGRSHGPTFPVSIGNNVWIGSGVRVLKGVTIGDNSIVGAMSLVTKSIPPDCIAAGNPARVISQLQSAGK